MSIEVSMHVQMTDGVTFASAWEAVNEKQLEATREHAAGIFQYHTLAVTQPGEPTMYLNSRHIELVWIETKEQP